MKILEEKNKNIKFSLSDPYVFTTQGIELFGSDVNTNELVLGLKLVHEGYKKDDLTEQKDNIFENIYNCSVNYIVIDDEYNFLHS